MTSSRRVRALPVLTVLAILVGCTTARPPEAVPDALEAEGWRRWAAHQERAEHTQAVIARARTEIEGASGAALSRQRFWLERPDKLRLEVQGMLGQPALAFATDGREVEIYRQGVAGIERGPLHDAVLWDLAGIPLPPREAVAALLAAPSVSLDMPQTVGWDSATGEVALGFPAYTLFVDAAGLLRRLRWHPEGHDWFTAHYEAWTEVGESMFPHRIELAFPANGGRALIRFADVEIVPSVDPARFRLRAPEPLDSAQGEDGG